MTAPELLIRSRTVPSASANYHETVPPDVCRATVPVGPHKYRIVKEPDPLKSMIGSPLLGSYSVQVCV